MRHPDGQIFKESFHSMMADCYPGADTMRLEKHIWRMYDTNKEDKRFKDILLYQSLEHFRMGL